METKTVTDPAAVGQNASPDRNENGKPMLLAGLRKSYDCDTRTEIPHLWQEFVPKMDDLSRVDRHVTYGLVFGGGGENDFDYMCAVEVSDLSNLPANFVTVEIPAHSYAVFVHPGPTFELPATMDRIFTQWLPTSGIELALNPDFLERYGEGFDPETMSGDIEIWVPIK